MALQATIYSSSIIIYEQYKVQLLNLRGITGD